MKYFTFAGTRQLIQEYVTFKTAHSISSTVIIVFVEKQVPVTFKMTPPYFIEKTS